MPRPYLPHHPLEFPPPIHALSMQRRGETGRPRSYQERVEESVTYVPAPGRNSGLEAARTHRSRLLSLAVYQLQVVFGRVFPVSARVAAGGGRGGREKRAALRLCSASSHSMLLTQLGLTYFALFVELQ